MAENSINEVVESKDSKGFIQKAGDMANKWYGKALLGLLNIGVVAGVVALDYTPKEGLGTRPAYAEETGNFNHLVPNLEGLSPYRTDTLNDAGYEITVKKYHVGKGEAWTFSVNNKVFAIGIDKDRKAPADYVIYNPNGNDFTKKYGINEDFSIPTWVK